VEKKTPPVIIPEAAIFVCGRFSASFNIMQLSGAPECPPSGQSTTSSEAYSLSHRTLMSTRVFTGRVSLSSYALEWLSYAHFSIILLSY